MAHAQVAPGEERLRYKVQIDAPKALADTLAKSLDLVRWQDFEDLTRDVLDRLLVEAKEQAREAAAAEGYFSPTVEVGADPAAGNGVRTVHLRVVPGEPTFVREVSIDVDGAANDDPLGRAAIARLRSEWALPVGTRFRQAAWVEAKTRALATLQASPYASARLVTSEARIDPEARIGTLSLRLESGPPFRFGALAVEGLAKYPVDIVQNFDTLVRGEPYRAERLEEFVRRLQSSGYFASVQARIEPDRATADAATVRVAVIEAPRRRVETGIAYSTDTRLRGDFRYTDVDLLTRALQLDAQARADTRIQNLALRVTRPPSPSGYLDSLQSSIERTDISGLQTHTAMIGVRRQTLEERNLTAWSLAYYEDDQHPAGSEPRRAHALYAEIARSWRTVDDLIAPTRGQVLTLRAGGAAPGLASRAFLRGIAQVAGWWPLGRRDTLEARAEAGAVLARERAGIPSALLFRTGGDTTVRGHAFESLGVQEGDAIVPGRYYAVASVEAAHYFTERWGAAAFVDAGNAADAPASLRPKLGYGIGFRAKSPIGPFRADVAYGQDTHKFRLHMSVGLTF